MKKMFPKIVSDILKKLHTDSILLDLLHMKLFYCNYNDSYICGITCGGPKTKRMGGINMINIFQ